MKPTIYGQFDAYLCEVALDVRRQLADANIGSMRLDIEISGRTHGSEGIKIVFVLGESYASYNAQGGDLNAVVEEAIRRHSWNAKNDPPMISASPPADNEVKF